MPEASIPTPKGEPGEGRQRTVSHDESLWGGHVHRRAGGNCRGKVLGEQQLQEISIKSFLIVVRLFADAKSQEAAQAYYDPNQPQTAYVPPPAYYVS